MNKTTFVAMIALAVTLAAAAAQAQSQPARSRGDLQRKMQGTQSVLVSAREQAAKFRTVEPAGVAEVADNLNSYADGDTTYGDTAYGDAAYNDEGGQEAIGNYGGCYGDGQQESGPGDACSCGGTGQCARCKTLRRGRHASNKAAGRGDSAVLNPCQASAGRALAHPWHCPYYHVEWGSPVALVVPPTAERQYQMGWGVGNTRMPRIWHQYGRAYPGAMVGGGGAGGQRFLATPPWPSDTSQFGVYYVRGPW